MWFSLLCKISAQFAQKYTQLYHFIPSFLYPTIIISGFTLVQRCEEDSYGGCRGGGGWRQRAIKFHLNVLSLIVISASDLQISAERSVRIISSRVGRSRARPPIGASALGVAARIYPRDDEHGGDARRTRSGRDMSERPSASSFFRRLYRRDN